MKINNGMELTKLPIKLVFGTKALYSLCPSPLTLTPFLHTLYTEIQSVFQEYGSQPKLFFYPPLQENRWSTAMTFQKTMF